VFRGQRRENRCILFGGATITSNVTRHLLPSEKRYKKTDLLNSNFNSNIPLRNLFIPQIPSNPVISDERFEELRIGNGKIFLFCVYLQMKESIRRER
jgi:hypothetical protein